MPLRVITRADTGTLWIVGTVRPAGAKSGIRVRTRAGTDDERLAGEEAAAREAAILRDFHHGPKVGGRSFAAACASYLTHQTRSAGTKAMVRRLLMHWRETPLVSITQEAVDQARVKLIRPDAGDATWRKTVAILAAVINHAAARKWCDTVHFDLPPAPAGRTLFLRPDQYEAVEREATPHLRPLLRYLVCTGCRLGEALILDWSQVDLRAGRVLVWADQTKGKRRRIVDLVPAAVAALARLPHRSGIVFLNQHGDPYPPSDEGGGQISAPWATACRRAGLPGDLKMVDRKDRGPLTRKFKVPRERAQIAVFTPEHSPHDLRHTWATWTYALRPDPFRLKQAGGWSSAELVERYAHLMEAGHETAIKRVWGTDQAVQKVVG